MVIELRKLGMVRTSRSWRGAGGCRVFSFGAANRNEGRGAVRTNLGKYESRLLHIAGDKDKA